MLLFGLLIGSLCASSSSSFSLSLPSSFPSLGCVCASPLHAVCVCVRARAAAVAASLPPSLPSFCLPSASAAELSQHASRPGSVIIVIFLGLFVVFSLCACVRALPWRWDTRQAALLGCGGRRLGRAGTPHWIEPAVCPLSLPEQPPPLPPPHRSFFFFFLPPLPLPTPPLIFISHSAARATVGMRQR